MNTTLAMLPTYRFLIALALTLCLITAGAQAQGPMINNDSNLVVIGGPGTLGCQGFDPPALGAGLPASATMDFSYDNTTGLLTLVVENTSMVFPQISNPVISTVWFNLPHLAVTGLTLVSQTTSAAGSPAPAFTMSVDTDLFSAPNPNMANCFGRFGVELNSAGPGPNGGIANPNALVLPGQNPVIGPVTFVFQVTGPNISTLSANAFSNSFSQNGAQADVNVAVKFQGGGPQDESGVIANGPACEPAAWVPSVVEVGELVQIVHTGAPGCFGCVICSFSPGPTPFGNALVPVGLPFEVITSAINPPTSVTVFDFIVPAWLTPGDTLYCVLVMADPGLQNVTISDQFVVTVTAP